MKSFRQLGVADAVVEALSRRGVESPFAIQTLVIPDGLNGQDLLAKSPDRIRARRLLSRSRSSSA